MTKFKITHIKYTDKDVHARNGAYVLQNTSTRSLSLTDEGHSVGPFVTFAVPFITSKMQQFIDGGDLVLLAQQADKRVTRPKKQEQQEETSQPTGESSDYDTNSTAQVEEKVSTEDPNTTEL